MKVHYFGQDGPDKDDIILEMAKSQGYVVSTCLLGGQIVMACINDGKNPCHGCNCDRSKCNGK